VTANILVRGTPEFSRILEGVARELVAVEQTNAGHFVKTPLIYPGGSSVVVQVGDTGNQFIVSDYGMGADEAELMGITHATFAKFAHAIADATGTRFDNHSFFVMEATREELPGAIVAVANASQAAVTHAVFKLADKSEQTDALLFARLETVFRPRGANVIRQAKVVGFSTTPWRVDALVRSHGKLTIFEAVSKHPNSINAAATKFFDIARTEDAPARFAVVHNKRELGTYLNVLSQAGNVIEDSMPDEAIAALAA